MKKNKSKLDILREAILSRNKSKIKKVLLKKEGDKWISIKVDYSKRVITYLGKEYSKEEMKEIIEEEEKACNLNIVIISFTNDPSEVDKDFLDFLKPDESERISGMSIS